MSPHFEPNISLCRKPVEAARRTNVRSRTSKLSTGALISEGYQDGWRSAALCTPTNEIDRIAVKQFISAGMIEKNGQ
jgi:hypothetical protein